MKNRLRILVAEDDLISRIKLLDLLVEFGICHVVVDGLEAVESVRNAINENRHYDVICLDIMMPNMSGIEALRQIRQLEAEMLGASSPRANVYFMTALDDIRSVRLAYNGEATGYFTKPIQRKWVIRELQEKHLIGRVLR